MMNLSIPELTNENKYTIENTKNSNKKATELFTLGRFLYSMDKVSDFKIIAGGEPQ